MKNYNKVFAGFKFALFLWIFEFWHNWRSIPCVCIRGSIFQFWRSDHSDHRQEDWAKFGYMSMSRVEKHLTFLPLFHNLLTFRLNMVNWNSFSSLTYGNLGPFFSKENLCMTHSTFLFCDCTKKKDGSLYTYAYNQNDETLPNLSKGWHKVYEQTLCNVYEVNVVSLPMTFAPSF
jgi:hypothetical protein